jgi:hypothetical protein
MWSIGFSTGALAFGDFRLGLSLLAGKPVRAVELSALREHELPTLMTALSELDLSQFTYVSVHAPSRLKTMKESDAAKALAPCIDLRWPVILHPDAIGDHGCWRDFGDLLCIENMDKRKPIGRDVNELRPHLLALPDASLCLDLGHARQVDATFGIARQILEEYGDRLKQLHLSELNARSQHEPLSMVSVWAVREIQHLIPGCPVILESVVRHDQIDDELVMAARCFEDSTRLQPIAAAG